MKGVLISSIYAMFAISSFAQIPEKIDRGVVALTVNENSFIQS